MGWRDVIGAVLDNSAARAPARGNNEPAASAKKPPAAASARTRAQAPALEPDRGPPESAWSARVFDQIEWRRFEAVCEALFVQSGMRAETQSHGADGGVDIWLYSQHSDKPVIVQCEHWKKRVVGVKELREFYGVLKSHDLTYGTFATSSTFSNDALAFAKSNHINAQDRDGLLKLIAGRSPEQQQALLDTAYEGEYWKPTCVKCGVKMVMRERRNQERFGGCANSAKTNCRAILRAN